MTAVTLDRRSTAPQDAAVAGVPATAGATGAAPSVSSAEPTNAAAAPCAVHGTVAAPAARKPAATPRKLGLGGLTPFTSIDYPGRLSAVVFVAGCSWRCGYCHNPHLQRRDRPAPDAPAWDDVLRWLERRVGLIDALVFSGGEPTLDAALPQAMRQVRALGFEVGLHSAGMLPRRLAAVLPLADWVGLDIKAPLNDEARHDRITAVAASAAPVRESLRLLTGSGVAFECRTTAHPALLDDASLLRLGADLAAAGVEHYALQLCRPVGSLTDLGPVPADYPAPETLDWLEASFKHFNLRRD